MVSVMLLAAIVAATALGVLAAYAVCRVMFGLMGARRPKMVTHAVIAKGQLS